MIRRKKLYIYVIAVFLVSLVWFVTYRGPPVRSSRASNNDARGFESIYPGEDSFGVRKHADYPTKRPTKAAPLLPNEPTLDTDAFLSDDFVANRVHVRDSVRDIEDEASGLLKLQERTPDITHRSPNTSAWQGSEKQGTASEERYKTHTATSTKSTHVTHASNMASYGRKIFRATTTVGYIQKSMQSRSKQLNGGAIRTSESTITKHDAEAEQRARVYENINLNEDNSRIFSKLSPPSKLTSSATSKTVMSYPAKVPTPRMDVDAMIRARRVVDAANRLRETNIVRDDITTLTIPTSFVDKNPIGTIQTRSKQLISRATRIAGRTPIKSEPSVKKKVTEQIAKEYHKIDLNVDNSRALSKLSLPSKRNGNGTYKKLVAYPTKVPRKEVDAMFRAKAVEDTANRERDTNVVRDDITITTLRVPSTLVDTDPSRSRQNQSKQLISSATRTTESTPTNTEQLAKQRDAEAKQIAQVYQNMNLNADNSRTFSKLSLPSKGNANGTSKKLVEYPTKVPRKDIDAMFRARAVDDAANRERASNLARDAITITTPISLVDADPDRLTQIRSNQLISCTTRSTESTPTKLEQLAKQRDAEAVQIAQVYENMNLNADNSRTFSKLSLPSKGNANGTSKNLVEYPTKVPRKDIDAMFRARAEDDAANRARASNLARDAITITTPISLVDADPNKLTQIRSKQLISRATRSTESTPTKLEQLAKHRNAEAKQIAQVYKHMNLNADNSRTFSKLSLPSKRITSGTPTKLVVYPTNVPQEGIVTLREHSSLADKVQPNRPKDVGVSHRLEGENVVSMSVYGSERRYTVGVVRNAEMIRENFPGWRLRVYTEAPSQKPRYGVLPQVSCVNLIHKFKTKKLVYVT